MGKYLHMFRVALGATVGVLVVLWLVGFIPGVSSFINTNILRKA